MSSEVEYSIEAIEIQPRNGWELVPLDWTREWIDKTPNQFARRCLPLMTANQMGWMIRCPVSFTAKWNGSELWDDAFDFTFREDSKRWSMFIGSHFGSGVVTFSLPWLFRTSSNVGLWARGAPNWPVDGATPLEGFIETDWAHFPFTMNWKISRPHERVYFNKGDPICCIVPYPVGFITRFNTTHRSIHDDPELLEKYDEWRKERQQFVARKDRQPQEWQKHYLRRVPPNVKDRPITRLHLSEFDLPDRDGPNCESH